MDEFHIEDFKDTIIISKDNIKWLRDLKLNKNNFMMNFFGINYY